MRSPRLSRRTLLATALLPALPALCPAAGAASPKAKATALSAAQTVLTRRLGPLATRVHLSLTTDTRPPWYEIAPQRDGALKVSGNSPVALTRGTYAALRRSGSAYVGWDGARLGKALTVQTPAHEEAAFAHRVYLNPCTFGYTTPFWDAARWTQEIDWMALNGIDMPLAMEGQEYVWRELWRAEGLSEAELAAYFSGPAFLPWHRMGNIEGYRGPLPDSWFIKKRDLQRHILAQMRALGMRPVLPAFAGYVPKAFALKHPQARIYRMIAWGGFHETYWLDPADPLFPKLARAFLDLYDATYGAGDYYLADAFNEMLPPISANGHVPARTAEGFLKVVEPDKDIPAPVRGTQLAAYGRALYQSVTAARPKAQWVMQGWMFSFQPTFWTPEAVSAFLSQVPERGVLILDLANDTYPGTWERNKAFNSKPWVFGYIHNFGGNNPLFGNLDLYRKDLNSLPSRRDTGHLSGVGLFPEGLNTNPVVYDYILDQSWRPYDQTIEAWLSGYARARYGHSSPAMDQVWAELYRQVYRLRNWDLGWREGFGTYVFCKRPRRDVVKATFDADLPALRKVVHAFASLAPSFAHSALYVQDAAAAVTHTASLHIDVWLKQAIGAYEQGDTHKADVVRTRIEAIVPQLDLLMGVQPQTLASWLDAARAYGDTPAEQAYYLDNARAQITVWGGDNILNDYASKAWQGLYEDFYLPRWQMFFEALRTQGASLDDTAIAGRLVAWEQAWVARAEPVTRRTPPDPFALMETVLTQLEANA